MIINREKIIKNLRVILPTKGFRKLVEIGCSYDAWLNIISNHVYLDDEIDITGSISDPEILGTIHRVDFRKTNIPDDWFNITSAFGWRHANIETGISHPGYFDRCQELPCCMYSVMMS